MNKMRVLLIVLAVVTVLALVVGVIFRLNKQGSRKPDGGDLSAVQGAELFNYHCGGGELNAYYDIRLENDSLTVAKSAGNGSRAHKKSYGMPPETVEHIQKLIDDSKLKELDKDLSLNDIFELDGETVSVMILWADGAHVSFDSNHSVPDYAWDTVNEIVRLLENIADK